MLPFVVGVGASAGGLEALEAFFRSMPSDLGVGFVVVQHLSPDHKSHMQDLLARHTAMAVVQCADGGVITPNTVHVLPPRKVVVLEGGRLRLQERASGLNLPIDAFFRSLADASGEQAIAIVLSGTGSDGMQGIRAIKEAGGLVLIQAPETARFDGMPRAALSLGLADHVLPPTQMGPKLAAYTRHVGAVQERAHDPVELEADSPSRLMTLLRRQTGVDFSRYKSTTVSRRIARRMAVHHVATTEEYFAICERSSDEVAALFKELLIGVTRFFRDPDVFEHVRTNVIPQMLDTIRPGEAVRVWVAGCATGEEAFTLAMLFEEYFDSARSRDLKIFATDIDRAALEFASAGIYPESVANEVSPERLSRFFSPRGHGFQVSRQLRQRVVFANHDVARDAPFSRVAMVSCRNLLIYFTPPLQNTVLSAFRFALRPGGYLLLGTSETLAEAADGFAHDGSPALKTFRRTHTPVLPTGTLLSERREEIRPNRTMALSHPTSSLQAAYDALVGAHAPPTVLVNDRNELIHVFGAPSRLLQIAPGAMTLNVLDLLPPSIAAVASTALHRTFRDGSEARYSGIALGSDQVTVAARAVRAGTNGPVTHVLLSLTTASESQTATADVDRQVSDDAQKQIVELRQELQSSRENLQATIEELETSNEELQATNEELVASNEELQSANEELQSVNEELHTLNSEYQAKIGELVRLNEDIDNLLRSANIGIVFLDAGLTITRFTPAATDVFNLLDRDIGRPIAHIASRVDDAWLHASMARVLKEKATLTSEFGLAGGRTFRICLEPYISEWSDAGGVVITAIEITALKEAEVRLARVIDGLPQRIAVVAQSGEITLVNEAWKAFARANGAADDTKTCVGANYLGVCAEATDCPEASVVQRQLMELLAGKRQRLEVEYPCHSPSEQRWFLVQAFPLRGMSGGAVVSHVDITPRKALELGTADHVAGSHT